MGGSASSRRENEKMMQNEPFDYKQNLMRCKKELRDCQRERDNLKWRLLEMEDNKARGILKVGEKKAKAVGNNANMMTINFEDKKGNNIGIVCNKDEKLNGVVDRVIGSMQKYCTAFEAYGKNLNLGETLEGLDFKDGTTITLRCDPIPVNVEYRVHGSNGRSHNNKTHTYTQAVWVVSPLEDIEERFNNNMDTKDYIDERVKNYMKGKNITPYCESTITYDKTYIKVVCTR